MPCISVDVGEGLSFSPAVPFSDIESPQAPLYSPLTPLIASKATKNIKLNKSFSPLRPMSPETLEIYKTLTEYNINFDVPVAVSGNSKHGNETNGILEHQDHISDFSCDTDSDFIPNSDEDSSEDEIPARRKIIVSATVHTSERCITRIDEPSTTNAKITDGDDIISTAELVESSRVETTTPGVELMSENITENYRNNNCDIAINENSENKVGNASPQGRPKKGRKRKNKEHSFIQTKTRKYANLPYHTKKKHVEAKVFRDNSCTCVKECHRLVPKDKREEDFQKYVTLGSYEAQLLFIVNCVKETPKSRSYTVTTENQSRGVKKTKVYTRTYTICGIKVCKNMFLNHLQITPKKVDVSLKKNRDGDTIKDKRGQTRGGWNKTKEEDVEFIKNIINALPKYESHYRRAQNTGNRQYLKLGMTVQKIYNLYKEELKKIYGEKKEPVSMVTLKRIFYTNFDLHCKSLKKDTCSRCDTFKNKINNSTGEEKEKLHEEHKIHLKRADDLRSFMNEDLRQAETDIHFECLTYDLEKTLPLPRIPTSIVFYKRQLWLYNCGIHAGSDDSGHCYVWIEGEAGRGAQEVGSCLINFIKNKLNPNVHHLVLWSDCCGGQNRNIKIVLMLKTILNSHETLQTITLKYLESGHTFLPNDTDFSKIETHLKYYQRLYTPEDYIEVIKGCKVQKQLQVTRMCKNDFLSIKNIEKKIVNRKVDTNKNKTNWLKTKEILLKKTKKYSVFMKTTMDGDEYQELNIEKKYKGRPLVISENDFVTLWPSGKEIPQAKLDDLESMFDLIPKDCIGFYKALKGNASIVDDVDGFTGPLDFDNEEPEQHEDTGRDTDRD